MAHFEIYSQYIYRRPLLFREAQEKVLIMFKKYIHIHRELLYAHENRRSCRKPQIGKMENHREEGCIAEGRVF